MNSDEYQDNLRTDYKIFGAGSKNYPKPKEIPKFNRKTLGKVVMDENDELHIITKAQKD